MLLKISILLALSMLDVQAIDTQGADFFVAFFPNPVGNAPYDAYHNALFISSFRKGSCNVSYDIGIRHEDFVAFNAGSFTRVPIPESAMTTIGGKIEQKGVHVFCSTNVSLHVFSYYGTVGAFTAIPLESLGNEYIFSGIDSNPYMGIVGTSDGTNVTVKFRSTCDYAFHQHLYKDGDTITFILNKNEVFQLSVNTMDYRHYRCDMVGSHIKSTAAVAVFSGSIYHQDASSHLVLQVPPPSAFTNLVILPRLVSSAAWKTNVRIIAAFSNTTLKTPKGVIILNSGEFKDLTFKAEQDAVIQSDKKVLVIHNCLFVPDGGFTSIVPGVDLYRKNYMIKTLDKSTSSDSPQQLVVTIVSHTESVHEVEINGAAPSEITWKHMTSVPYSVGVVELPTRPVYRVNSTDPILVRVHVYNARQTHGYVAGYKSTPVTHKVSEILKLQCLSQGYLITLDLSALDIDVQDSSHIFMTLDTCTGILQGTVLTFNIPYETCGTKVQIKNGRLVFTNTIIYAIPSSDNVIRNSEWEYDIVCGQ